MWLKDDMLSRNDDKTEVMLFASGQALGVTDHIVLRVGDSHIGSVPFVGNLGAMFDTTVSMEKQVDCVCRSAYFRLRNIGQIRGCLTTDATRCLVNGLVMSGLDYCNALLSGIPEVLLNKLQKVRNTAARVVARTPGFCHVAPVLGGLRWLPVERRVQFRILTNTFKCLQGMAPGYLSDLISVIRPERVLRSADAVCLTFPRVCARYGERRFGYCAAELWSSLPPDIRNLPEQSFHAFGGLVGTRLFQE
jgi:hypothetical protein